MREHATKRKARRAPCLRRESNRIAWPEQKSSTLTPRKMDLVSQRAC